MTDKTPKKTAENPMNIPRTMDATRGSEPKSRALPQADALKERFKAGSIPLQTDFADLIDLANMGRQAVGGAEGQTGPANGFTLSSMGLLELKPNAAKGISVDKDGIAVKAEGNKGLQVTNDGVSVKPGNGIAVNSSGVNIKLAKGASNNGGGGQGTNGFTSHGSAGGLELSANGLSVNAGNGIQIDTSGVSIKLAANSGLSADETNGVSVKVGKGMRVSSTGMIEPDVDAYGFGIVEEGVEYAPVKVNTSTNGLVVDLDEGLISTASGLSVNVGNGLQADQKNGVSLIPEQMLQKGMVMMFAGTANEIPKGWAICNGSNGTPDLRDRFIVMAGTKYNGKGEGSTTTGNATVTGTVTVGETKLSINQIPAHTHTYTYRDYAIRKYNGESWNSNYVNGTIKGTTSSVGGGEGHDHTATLSTNTHSHTFSAVPPYYALIFIMKL